MRKEREARALKVMGRSLDFILSVDVVIQLIFRKLILAAVQRIDSLGSGWGGGRGITIRRLLLESLEEVGWLGLGRWHGRW